MRINDRGALRTEDVGIGIRSPEKNLVLAILLDAVEVIRACKTRTERESKVYVDAVEWIRDSFGYPFSFPALCSYLGLDPDATRRAILRDYTPPRRMTRINQRRLYVLD